MSNEHRGRFALAAPDLRNLVANDTGSDARFDRLHALASPIPDQSQCIAGEICPSLRCAEHVAHHVEVGRKTLAKGMIDLVSSRLRRILLRLWFDHRSGTDCPLSRSSKCLTLRSHAYAHRERCFRSMVVLGFHPDASSVRRFSRSLQEHERRSAPWPWPHVAARGPISRTQLMDLQASRSCRSRPPV